MRNKLTKRLLPSCPTASTPYINYEELGDMEALQRMAKKIIMMQPKIKSPATEAMMDSARNKIEHVNHNIR